MNDIEQKAVINDMELKALVGAHTPGPWRTGGPSDGFVGNVLADNPRRLIAQVTVQDGEQTLANARLMAVAPDLLERYLATKQELSDFRQEVSDALMANTREIPSHVFGLEKWVDLQRFIIPKPKPDLLEEAMVDETTLKYVNELQAYMVRVLKLEARGLEIREKNDDKDSHAPISIEHLGELLSQLDSTILTDNERAEILIEAYERMTALQEQSK